jgi:hypothetical protein
VTHTLRVESLIVRFRSIIELVRVSSYTLLSLSILEMGGLLDNQNVMLFLDVCLRSFQHCEEIKNELVNSRHIILKHEAFITWWGRLQHPIILGINRDQASKLFKTMSVACHLNGMLTDRVVLLHLTRVKNFSKISYLSARA